MLTGILIVILAGLVAFAVTAIVRRNASGFGLVQAPNERSSHSRPTPSGGGVGIVAGGIIAALPLALAQPWPLLPLLGLSLLVAVIGFIDDRRPIPAPARLGLQLALLAAALVALPLDSLLAAIGLPLPSWLVIAGLVIATGYWLNLFNFMDGIDGIAGSQAIFMLLGAALLLLVTGTGDAPLIWWMVGIAAATLGFLSLNWPPAKIFMGDAGSTWLGFTIAVLALWTIALGWLNLWQWLILGALFIADATVTLLRRLARRENPLKAHRLHAYQHLSRRWGSHAPVTLLYLALNIVLLLPLAWAAGWSNTAAAPVATIAAYLPLIAGLLWAGAGAKEIPR